jgi:hypothetical protein
MQDGSPDRKTMGSESATRHDALDKRENPLSEEEIHFIRTCWANSEEQ